MDMLQIVTIVSAVMVGGSSGFLVPIPLTWVLVLSDSLFWYESVLAYVQSTWTP